MVEIRYTKAMTKTFRNYTITIPSGLRCTNKAAADNLSKGLYFLDEFPEEIFPKNSLILFDAKHYGFLLEESEVTK